MVDGVNGPNLEFVTRRVEEEFKLGQGHAPILFLQTVDLTVSDQILNHKSVIQMYVQ